ncbi:uncharacterized protein N7515_006087 [Penicillium bovifimosum]|uniref:Integral membrane protein n=1 Tax=Penicillium bovifimosum TaxID=126998 RepID=A0A9W9GUA3_9EURO|nr:uncharacterized protein N7515_006087 [Penicillium bovifimosum]KAJ5130048.1 hypothetical protein N7515_006087 [Penicillium bovifimosum]
MGDAHGTSDTIVAPPSQLHKVQKIIRAKFMEIIRLQRPSRPSPSIPIFPCEASDITSQNSEPTTTNQVVLLQKREQGDTSEITSQESLQITNDRLTLLRKHGEGNTSDITLQEAAQPINDQVTLVNKRGRFRLHHQQQYKNSLLAGVGYLELANAGDFAANVWNEIPVPKFAAVLMGLGGILALGMVVVAVRDLLLSWKNIKLLRVERAHLQSLQESHKNDTEMVQLIENRLGVGAREIGTELVDRLVMDAFMGFGSLLVGIGTLMAIGGANPRVYKTSNLLSGYIGNGLAAAFGVANAVWSGYLVRRFHLHHAAVFALETNDTIRRRLHTRFRRFQWHAGINGVNGLVAGAASMVTAERWWGYVVLIPCIIILIVCNYFWRKKLGYDRPLVGLTRSIEKQSTLLFEELQQVIMMQSTFAELEPSLPQAQFRRDYLDSILRLIVDNNMFESFCESLAHDKRTQPLFNKLQCLSLCPQQITISHQAIFWLPTTDLIIVLQHAQIFLQREGVAILIYRERYLLELLGYAIWQDHQKAATA